MCLYSWRNSNDFSNSQSTRRELLCHPKRMRNSSTPSQSVTCNPKACGTVAFQLQFIYKTTQVSLCMLQFTMTVFYVLLWFSFWLSCNNFWSFMFARLALVAQLCRHNCVFSSGFWSYFRMRLLNKASCNCKDSNKTVTGLYKSVCYSGGTS